MRTTKKKKTKQRQTRKKRGGAHGLQVEILYNGNNEIVDIRTSEILATKDYIKMNKIDPKYGFMDLMRDTFNFRDVIGNTHDFFHPFDPPTRNTRTRRVKIAINDKRDVQLIQITNKILKVLNGMKNKVSIAHPFIVVRRNNRMTKESMADFAHAYNLLLRQHEEKLLESFEDDDKLFKVAQQLLRTPVLVNLLSIKFGLLRRGDLKLREIRQMFNKTDRLNDSLSELKGTRKRPTTVSVDDIIQDEKKKEENKKIDAQIECEAKGTCPENLDVNPIVVTPEEAAQEVAVNPIGATSNEEMAVNPISVASNEEAPKPAEAPLAAEPEVKVLLTEKQQSGFKQFDELLSNKFPSSHKQYAGNAFPDELSLNKYLIESIIAGIKIDKNILIKDKYQVADTYESQALILTMIRLLLTSDMKFPGIKYTEVRDKFFKEYNGDICSAAESVLGSGLGQFFGKYSYQIIAENNIEDVCTDFQGIIRVHLNKLYEMFSQLSSKEIIYLRVKAVKDTTNMTTTLPPPANPFDETYDPNSSTNIF